MRSESHALEDLLVVRHLELRHEHEEGRRLLLVVVTEGAGAWVVELVASGIDSRDEGRA